MKSKFILLAAICSSTVALAQPSVTTAGSKYAVIEESTGVWCGYCPDGAYRLEGILTSNAKAIGISVHDNNNSTRGDQNSNDMMESLSGYGYDYTHTSTYCNGYPNGSVDRVVGSDGKVGQSRSAWAGMTSTALANTPKFDVTVLHAYKASTGYLSVWVYAKTLTAVTGSYNINAVLTEDSIKSVGTGYAQHSYFYNDATSPFYRRGVNGTSYAVLGDTDYAHRHVLREMFGGTFGTSGVIADNSAINKTYSKKYTFKLDSAGYNKKRVYIIGMVQKWNATDVKDRAIENAIQAKFDSTAVQLGLDEITSNLENMQMYPNPASNQLSIFANLISSDDAVITINNIVGQTVMTHRAQTNGEVLAENLDISSLSNGVYLVNVTCGNSSVIQKLVVSK